MTVYPIQANFSRGVIDPLLHDRADIEYYKAGLKDGANWHMLVQGGLRKRSGFQYVREVKDSNAAVRLVPFQFSTEQAYVLEFGNTYVRHFANGGIITTAGGTPTAITQANPGAVTLAGHGFTTGDRVIASSIGGMFELDNRELTVTVTGVNTFTIGIDTTAYTAFTAGGTIKKIVETTTIYSTAQAAELDYAQTADVLTLVHEDRKPRELTRTSDTAWTFTAIDFIDGPYMDPPRDNTNGVTADATNAIHPKMTANNLPAGVVANSDADPNAYVVFDQVSTPSSTLSTSSGDWSYTPAAAAVCNNYWIKADAENPDRAPGSWIFQGYDGVDWIDIDRRTNETAWGSGEVRFYEFTNAVAYDAYRISIEGSAGATGRIDIAEMGWGYNGDYGPTITLTFDTTANINDGAGFDSDDVNRHIRIQGTDGKWRWFIVEAVNSTVEVEGRMYGFALPNLSKIYAWKLGAWKNDRWPSRVQFYEARRGFARSNAEPNVIWLSKAFDFYDMGTSDPLTDDDAMRLRILSNEVNGITWLAELERLAIGTTGGVRVLGKANGNAGFGATNFDLLPNVFTRSKSVKPLRAGSVLLFANYYGRTLHELVYDLNADGYIAPDTSILSAHLLQGVITEMAWQDSEQTAWIVLANGDLVAMTYNREQKVVGFMPQALGRGDDETQAQVESVCVIPGENADEVWVAVKRIIGGVTRRTIERKADSFDGDDVEDAVFLDSSLSYSGTATGTVTGLWHLAGQTVNVLGDGIVYRDLVVTATGAVTLPNAATAAKWCVGLPYKANGRTLAVAEHGQSDGIGLGRRKTLNFVGVSVFETLDLQLKGVDAADWDDVIRRSPDIDPAVGPMVLRTERISATFDNSWRDDGEFLFRSADPLPCTIRAFVLSVSGEP